MISEALKSETRKDHDHLESGFNLKDMTASSDHYLSTLKAFYGFYIPLEKEFKKFESEFSGMGIDLNERLKTQFLRMDMKQGGLSDDQVSTIPLASQIPMIKDFSEAMAVLYVLEGSTLGGQVISKELGKIGLASQFFNPYEKNTMPMWLKFKNALNTLPEDEEAKMVITARETFKLLGQWLRAQSPSVS